jgi:hypothetical protein
MSEAGSREITVISARARTGEPPGTMTMPFGVRGQPRLGLIGFDALDAAAEVVDEAVLVVRGGDRAGECAGLRKDASGKRLGGRAGSGDRRDAVQAQGKGERGGDDRDELGTGPMAAASVVMSNEKECEWDESKESDKRDRGRGQQRSERALLEVDLEKAIGIEAQEPEHSQHGDEADEEPDGAAECVGSGSELRKKG